MNERKDKFYHILIVDDDPHVRELMATLLQAPNRSIERRDTPRAALQFAKQNPVDIAFVDSKLPGMSGSELGAKLKTIHPRSHVVIWNGELNAKHDSVAIPSKGEQVAHYGVDFGETLQLADSYTTE
jgi:two-component system, LytTR family, response regulator